MGISAHIFSILNRIGTFYQHEELFPYTSSIFPFFPGPEDMELDQSTGFIYGISFDRWAQDSLEHVQGKVWSISPDDVHHYTELSGSLPVIFHPHGMSLYREDSILWLFVINHIDTQTECVEVFIITGEQHLSHIRTISDPEIVSANDLVAISPDAFYLVNDGRSRDPMIRGWDIFMRNKTGNVILYDNKESRIVAEDLEFPNGINIHSKESLIFVTETIGGNVRYFRRDNKNSLHLEQTIHLFSGLDNISIGPEGHLWIAVQPNLLAVNRLLKTPTYTSPSGVIRLTPTPKSTAWEWKWRHDGHSISGVSVALYHQQQLILGSVCEPRIAICKLDTTQ